MTYPDLITRLETELQAVHTFLQTVSPADWQRPQGPKWTIAEEIAHLLSATVGTARLFGPGGNMVWKPFDPASRPARPYDEICDQYRTALATRNPVAPTTPTTDQPAPDQQATVWQSAAQSLIHSLKQTISEADLDTFTVWKHPLLGPVTGREMLFFTAYHTERHLVTLRAKQSV